MTTQVIHKSLMPWDDIPSNQNVVRILSILGVLLALFAYLIVPRIELPEVLEEEIPERFAELIIEEEKPEPPPPLPEVEEKEEILPEEEPEPEPEPLPEPDPEPEIVEKPNQTVEEARAVVEEKLAPLKDAFAGFEGLSSSFTSTSSQLITSDNTQRKIYAGSDLQTDLSEGSGGIDVASKLQVSGAASNLGERAEKKIEGKKVQATGSATKAKTKKKETPKRRRSDQQIALANQALKGKLDLLLNKARRKNPSLSGDVVFRVSVDASGKVTKVEVVSSELGDDSLTDKMAKRIRLMGNYGPGIVETFDVPVSFTN